MKVSKLKILILLGIISSLYFFYWWFKDLKVVHPIFLFLFISSVVFSVTQIFSGWFIYWKAAFPKLKRIKKDYSVDVFIPTYNEPNWLVEKAIKAATEISYPHTTYVIDDGRNEQYKNIAQKYGAKYITRNDNKDYKAGNINNALNHSTGEIIAIFDIDHIPENEFLTNSLGYFENEKVGAVQVILDYSNSMESYTSKACASLSDNYFGPTILGLNQRGCVTIFGSNSLFRRETLNSIGGYKPGLAEDLHTSINIHAHGWKTEYVPVSSAKGLVPADLESFNKQQFKWARGVFEVFFEKYPKLIFKLGFEKNICYLNRMSSYLAGPVIFLHIISILILLISAGPRYINEFNDYVIHAAPFFIFFMLINRTANEIFYTKKGLGKMAGIYGFLLAAGSWHIYTLAFLLSVFRIKIPFIATPKEKSAGSFLKLVFPQVFIMLLIAAGIFTRYLNGIELIYTLPMFAAVGIILVHLGIFFAAYEDYRTANSETKLSESKKKIVLENF